jgi:hypothetical protein
MAQYGPPGSKPPERRYGLLGAMPKLDCFGPGLGIDDLRARGWTLKLIEKFLGDEDRRDSVSHWANFSGKKVYLVARVESAEAMPEFEVDFIISAQRHNLPRDYDPDIARIAAALKPYGEKYTDQFASAYLAINDKSYLAMIVQKIIATAKQDAAQRS